MAELSAEEGQLAQRESLVLKNLMLLRETPVTEAMTPRPVVFSVPDSMTVEAFFDCHEEESFSRIPLYEGDPDQVDGFVLRSDLLLARAHGGLGESGLAHRASAEEYALAGAWLAAIEQLRLAQRGGGLDFFAASQVDARLRDLQAEYARERKDDQARSGR